MKINKNGLLPAVELIGYVFLITQFMLNGEKFFGQINKSLGPIMFLTVFCFSALTCSLIVFYKPYMLLMDKKGKEAGELVLSTAKWLGLFVMLVIVGVAMMSG